MRDSMAFRLSFNCFFPVPGLGETSRGKVLVNFVFSVNIHIGLCHGICLLYLRWGVNMKGIKIEPYLHHKLHCKA